tara:strand:- start:756 stop:905 length:150 start_codon:yes stop_codon:yes gene_type:complete
MPLEITTLISNLGFPIVVSLYFMFRVEKTMKENTKATQELKEAIITKFK